MQVILLHRSRYSRQQRSIKNQFKSYLAKEKQKLPTKQVVGKCFILEADSILPPKSTLPQIIFFCKFVVLFYPISIADRTSGSAQPVLRYPRSRHVNLLSGTVATNLRERRICFEVMGFICYLRCCLTVGCGLALSAILFLKISYLMVQDLYYEKIEKAYFLIS